MMESYIHTADISAHDEIELKKSEITNFENNMNQENFFLNYLMLQCAIQHNKLNENYEITQELDEEGKPLASSKSVKFKEEIDTMELCTISKFEKPKEQFTGLSSSLKEPETEDKLEWNSSGKKKQPAPVADEPDHRTGFVCGSARAGQVPK